jgi:hypothetical protein
VDAGSPGGESGCPCPAAREAGLLPAWRPGHPPGSPVTDRKVGAHRHIDFVYVCRASGGELAAQVAEIASARWVPVADIAGLPTPSELPELVAAAARWAKALREAPPTGRA